MSAPSPASDDDEKNGIHIQRPAILSSSYRAESTPHSPTVYMHGISTPIQSPEGMDTPMKKKFKYLSPRIGSYFQAQIEPFTPKDDDNVTLGESSQGSSTMIMQSSTTPAASSALGPGRKRKAGRPKGTAYATTTTAATVGNLRKQESNLPETYEPSRKVEQTKRGAICVHRPLTTTNTATNTTTSTPGNQQQELFLNFGRNLMLQTPRHLYYNIARVDQCWKKALEDKKYPPLQPLVVKNKPGRKRKLVEKEEEYEMTSLKTTTTATIANISTNVFPTQESMSKMTQECISLGLEDDEYMLEYYNHHNRNISGRAEFLTMVALCRGKAMSMRRKIKKMSKDDGINMPLSAVIGPLSDSWRRRYERGAFSKVIGDLRQNTTLNKYPFYEIRDSDVLDESTSSNVFPWIKEHSLTDISTSKASLDETKIASSIISKYQSYNDLEYVERNKELLEEWKFVFESGQNILEHSKGGLKPFLRDLLQILSKAYTIPSPEEVFGRRDSTAKNISMCLNSIMDLVDQGRDTLAYFTDGAYDAKDIGIDVQSLFKHFEKKYAICPVQLEEAEIMQSIIKEALDWESRLENSGDDDDASSSASEDLHLPQQSLFSAEELASEGNSLSIRPKSLVNLEDRIQRAYDLRQRIREWNQSNNDNESVKYLASMIKDANKINLGFPELSLLSKVHKNAEEWIERANIALRSKISLLELEELVHLGDKLPLGVTTTLDKLRSRLNSAVEWIADLKEVVPCPLESVSECGAELDARLKAEWFLSIWEILRKDKDDDIARLKEISTSGARLPVEVEFVHLLQTAIDARNWSLKARRWVPSSSDFRRGKIDDLMDHLEFSKTILSKFSTLTDGVVEWKLDYAEELQEIVDKAEIWFEKYEPYLAGDARKSQRPVISCETILDIIKGAEEIPSNLGNPTLKINRIHNEVKNWVESHSDFLQRCNITCVLCKEPTGGWTNKPVSFHEVTTALESASKDMSVDLEEVQKLTEMVELSQEWFDKVHLIAPIHGKRSVGYGRDGTKSKTSVVEVSKLLKAAHSVPMDTTKDVERLQSLLDESLEWARGVYHQLRGITKMIPSDDRDELYGEPSDILSSNDNVEIGSEFESSAFETNSLSQNKKQDHKGIHLYQMINELANSADKSPFMTLEEELVQHLAKTVQWCKTSSEIIDSYYDSFGSVKWKDDLKTLMKESKYLDIFGQKFMFPFPDEASEDYTALHTLNESFLKFIEREKERLSVLQRKQDDYDVWCKKVHEKYEESEKRVPLSLLVTLFKEGSAFPTCSDVVRKLSRDFRIATEWVGTAKEMLASSNKLSFDDVKSFLNRVHRVKFTSEEYETLRRALNDAKAWSNQCKKSGLDNGSAPIHVLKALMNDYERLRIELPDEINALKEALCGYCICRRPYEGFMIGCDTCDEWYHGSCIGISEAQGEKIEKFICVRCHVKKLYEAFCLKIAAVIKKWCDPKELSKSRSQDNQKHQRKVREKKKEIEKWKEELQNNLKELQDLKAMQSSIASSSNESQILESSNELFNHSVAYQNGGTLNEQETKGPVLFTVELYEKKINTIKVDIAKATKALEQCNFRMERLNQLSNTRKAIQNQEDRMAPAFRFWCTLVRQSVLVPDTEEVAQDSRPNPPVDSASLNELLSNPMKEVIKKITELGLNDFQDAFVIKESLYGIGWCCLAFNVLKKKPKLEQIQTVVHLSELARIAEGKCLTMIKSMIATTLLWTAKVKHDLMSTPGNMEPYDPEMLKKLSFGMISVPLTSPEEMILCNVLKDEGAKHCLCCSPRDSSMISCLSCDKWYHSQCVPSPILDSKDWVCDQCLQSHSLITKKISKNSKKSPGAGFIDWSTEAASQPSAHAPTAEKLWPPFGLSGSTESMNILGVALTYNPNQTELPVPAPISFTFDHIQDSTSMNQSNQYKEKPPQAISTPDHSRILSTHLANNYGTPPATAHANKFSISGIDETIVQNAVKVALEIAINGLSDVSNLNGCADNMNTTLIETVESKQGLSQQDTIDTKIDNSITEHAHEVGADKFSES